MGRILVVDDDPDVLESITTLLASLGHEAWGVTDADEALQSATGQRPDVILHDLRMPGLHLAGMVASLRSHPATAGIPLVFFSARPDVAEAAAKYDAWGYLRKPFAEPELVALLDAAMAGAAPLAQADLEELFHDFWNTLSALTLSAATLRHKPADATASKRVDELLLVLASKADRLRAGVTAAMEARAH